MGSVGGGEEVEEAKKWKRHRSVGGPHAQPREDGWPRKDGWLQEVEHLLKERPVGRSGDGRQVAPKVSRGSGGGEMQGQRGERQGQMRSPLVQERMQNERESKTRRGRKR